MATLSERSRPDPRQSMYRNVKHAALCLSVLACERVLAQALAREADQSARGCCISLAHAACVRTLEPAMSAHRHPEHKLARTTAV